MKRDHSDTAGDLEPTMRRVDLADAIAQCGQTGVGTMKARRNKKGANRRQTLADKLAEYDAALARESALSSKSTRAESRQFKAMHAWPAALKVRASDHKLFPMLFDLGKEIDRATAFQRTGYFSRDHIDHMRRKTWRVIDEAPAPSGIGKMTRIYCTGKTAAQRVRANKLIAAFDCWQVQVRAATRKWKADPGRKAWEQAVSHRYAYLERILEHAAVDLSEAGAKARFIISVMAEIEDDHRSSALAVEGLASDFVRLCSAGSAVAQ